MPLLPFDPVRLGRIGLTPALTERAVASACRFDEPLTLARLSGLHRETARTHDGDAEASARVRPRLVRDLTSARAALAVGDWVLVARDAHGEPWIAGCVPPSTRIVRRDGDGVRHAVVSNVDRIVVVMGCEDDFNLRRLERYLAIACAAEVRAAVVLTKADVVGEAAAAARVAALQARIIEPLDVFAVDATSASAATTLAPLLEPGSTLVLLGSSGAGKSTLANTLLCRPAQDTGFVREHDGRGMHTTTARSLHLLPGAACLIDTPGLRTLRVDADESAVSATFADVQALALRCRFRDCTHGGEPGCAVREAVDADRLRNFHKLLRETRRDALGWLERRQQVAAWKSRGKAARVRMRMKRGDA